MGILSAPLQRAQTEWYRQMNKSVLLGADIVYYIHIRTQRERRTHARHPSVVGLPLTCDKQLDMSILCTVVEKIIRHKNSFAARRILPEMQ